ncbi:MAG TPA: RIP metalloprotease RseP [Thauera sp.]|uniref:RIP metalloprotease RseP n=1 Tax=unclassified Thauera TaxID=2609274 RepID=UPI0002CEABAA|nr:MULTISPECIES: RIP metalloprotease RseP [unclassified Thauera]HAY11631.1 RIP metalloprotease RseP [Thauera sp.]ENO92602.1 membrane-associated zinc metalloprotease [Thauera sp. 28]WBL62552.1 RIP metalloprotease RseP [Thauera sp. WB-2]HNR59522.1 RIP metalloprotease RseP [Thauera sp.]HNS91502.1 RIP metalloprotease RseP [Thauera sp.]
MNLLDYLLPFALALGVLILVHELGHYLVARWCGVKVLRFSIGFGKPLIVRRAGRDGTEWALAAFPLGGYVKMLDEREAAVAPEELHRTFNRQSVYRRFAIVAAGPLANFLLAIVLYWGLFVAGTDELRARVALSETPQVAEAAGVRDGDLVLAVDEQSVRSWQDLRWILLQHTLDQREVVLRVRTLEDVEAFRRLDLAGVRIDDDSGDLIARLGLKPWRPQIPAVIGRLVEGGAAARAGLQSGDEVTAIDGVAITSWSDLVQIVRDGAGRELRFDLRRDAAAFSVVVTPDEANEGGARVGRIGVGVADPAPGGLSMFAEVRYGPLEAMAKAVRQTWETSVLSLRMIGRMFTGEVSWKNLSGPVTIADYAGQTAQLGLSHYLKFVALISISLGVLNLLPIPVLDGGHLMYYTVEIIKGGPIPERVMEIGQQIGLALLVMLMAFAFFNDINRLISG